MSIRDAKNLWSMYSKGIIGPYKDYIIAYQQNAQLHSSQQLFIQVNSKKHKVKPVMPFSSLYPDVYMWWNLGHEPIASDSLRPLVNSVAGLPNAPQWLINRSKEK